MSLDIGSKVTYKDSKGKQRSGVIHAVRKVDTKSGTRVVGYLVDTGKDERVDEIVRDPRGEFIAEKANEMVANPKDPTDNFLDAVDKVVEAGDLPKQKITVEKVRQPQQVEVDIKDIRAAE